eukprot:TRINITY_DN49177_c0_g1_i1.p1 TRINITY_DN49177_c0_g1~~TRINITY_DN49177_c0_g1_i1.p1  ORF type:complete len:201 (+),score=49.60 TRINITY_DN49177_c0_g1_i1:239-841(+)
MKPAWDKLADTHKDSSTLVVADVDCTSAEAKSVCHDHGIRGYPTIKYFSDETGMSGEDYRGGRSFEDLDAFANEHLAKPCDPATFAHCSEKEKAYVEKQAGKDAAKLTAELERLRSLLAGAMKDDGKGKEWIVKRTKILEALIGPTLLGRIKKMWSKLYFTVSSRVSRWFMSLVDFIEVTFEPHLIKLEQWWRGVGKSEL